jgi:hypothetical protein
MSVTVTPSANRVHHAAPRFDGVNWPIWKMKIRAYMLLVGPKNVLDASPTTSGTSASSTTTIVKKKTGKDEDQHRAYATLMMCLDDARIMLLMSVPEGDATGAWAELVKYYERTTMASKAHTRSMMHKTKMSDDEEFDAYKSRIMQLRMKLKAMNADVGDEELMYVLLEGLPESCSQLKQSLEVQNELTVDEACNHIRDHQEKAAHRRLNGEIEEAHMSRADTRHGGGGGGGGGGGSQRDFDVKKHRCRLCTKIGHMEWDCAIRKGGDGDCFKCGHAGHTMRDYGIYDTFDECHGVF